MTPPRAPAAPPAASAATGLDWLGVVLLCAAGALAGLLELLLVPLYAGSVIIPVAVLLAVLTNFVLPRLARGLVPSAAAAIAPFLLWLVVVLGLSVITRPEGDVLLPGGSLQWVSYGLLLGGGLAGVIGVVTSAPPPPQRAGTPGSRR